ncbi:hypothetical protein NW762_013430 [Fusarium torreyae]|uniref:Uncharacterized protein n=1 Tax=Fusarium torreyae TaxID=1237075 RepID=A0A9W8VAH7_9HYPO|nr:hypothetical protein NW762_013430 [Fusarium torreyae]
MNMALPADFTLEFFGNCEAINILRKAGVPEPQLMAVQGGERIPLFSRETREQAEAGEIDLRPGPPGGPPIPHPSHAVLSVDVWPSLHCLIPEGHLPDVFDTATRYTGAAHSYVCTFDVNYGMKHGLLKLDKLIPEEKRSAGISSFIEYVDNREKWQFSDHDGGQLMYNIHVAEKKTILWNAHLGGYEGILRDLDPKPQMVILGIAGRANHDGRPFEGSGAEFASRQVEWLGRPDQLIWCLHDESVVPPYRVDTRAAREAVESMGTKVIDMEPNKLKHLTI